MKKRFLFVLLAAMLLIILASCGETDQNGNKVPTAVRKFAGVYTSSPSMDLWADYDEWVFAKDGTGVVISKRQNGKATSRAAFDYTIENDHLFIEGQGNPVSVSISKGEKYTTLSYEESGEIILKQTGEGPGMAYNKNPDPKKLAGRYFSSSGYYNGNYYFSEDGVFEFSFSRYENYDTYDRFRCPYRVEGNKIILEASAADNYTGFAKKIFQAEEYAFNFDLTGESLIIFGDRSDHFGPIHPADEMSRTDGGAITSFSLPSGVIGYATIVDDSVPVEYFFDENIGVEWDDGIGYDERRYYNKRTTSGETYAVYSAAYPNPSKEPWYMITEEWGWLPSTAVRFSTDVNNSANVAAFDVHAKTTPDTPSDVPAGVIGYATILINDLNIRTGPNTTAKIKGLAKQYKEYEVYSKTTAGGYTWYQIGTDEWVADDGSWVSFSTERRGSTDKPIAPYEDFFGDWEYFYKYEKNGHYFSTKSRGLRLYKDGTWVKFGGTSGIGGNWKAISKDTLALLLDSNGDGNPDKTYNVKLFTVYNEAALDNKNTLSKYEPETGDTPFCMLTEENGSYCYYTKLDKSEQTPDPTNVVYVSVYQNHTFAEAKDGSPVDEYPVVISQNGATIKDIIILIHKELCPDGENGCAFETNAYGEAIIKLWGIDNGGHYSYYVDEAMADSVNDVVTPLSFLDLFIE